jgi:hypothetical protein
MEPNPGALANRGTSFPSMIRTQDGETRDFAKDADRIHFVELPGAAR